MGFARTCIDLLNIHDLFAVQSARVHGDSEHMEMRRMH